MVKGVLTCASHQQPLASVLHLAVCQYTPTHSSDRIPLGWALLARAYSSPCRAWTRPHVPRGCDPIPQLDKHKRIHETTLQGYPNV